MLGGASAADMPPSKEDDEAFSSGADSNAAAETGSLNGKMLRGDFWQGGNVDSDVESDPSEAAAREWRLSSEGEDSRSGGDSQEEASEAEGNDETGSEGEGLEHTRAEGNIAEDEDIPNDGIVVSGVPAVVGLEDVGRQWAALQADLSRDAHGKQQQLLAEIAWDLEMLNEQAQNHGEGEEEAGASDGYKCS